MSDDPIRFKSRLPGKTLGFLGLFILICAMPSIYVFSRGGNLTFLFLAAYCIFSGAWMLYAFTNRDRPVLEVRDREITCGSILGRWYKTVAIDDVEAWDEARGLLRLRSGREVRVPLGEIPKARRSEALRTLNERIQESQERA